MANDKTDLLNDLKHTATPGACNRGIYIIAITECFYVKE